MQKILLLLVLVVAISGGNFELDLGEGLDEFGGLAPEVESDFDDEVEEVDTEVESSPEDVEKTNSEKAELSLQITKVDQEAGVTVEDNELYQELDRIITENPLQGAENDFSLYVVDIIETDTEELWLFLMGINRLPTTIQNISFDFTFGNTDGEYVWEDYPLIFEEPEFGAIDENKVFPVFIPLTDEQAELVTQLNEDNQIFEMNNFEYEEVN